MKSDEEIDLNTFKSTIGVNSEDTIHVNNFPHHWKEEDLRGMFRDFGEIKRVSVHETRKFNEPRSYAFITFESAKNARKALNLDGHKVMNRPLRVTLAQNEGTCAKVTQSKAKDGDFRRS